MGGQLQLHCGDLVPTANNQSFNCGTVPLEGFKRARISELEHEAGNCQQGDGKGKQRRPVRAMWAHRCHPCRNGKGHACAQKRVFKGQCPVPWNVREQPQ
jgi:hypothetical protein